MAAPEFVPSQRWISNTESELGLGIVVEYANRRVTLSFPAASEQRTYAADSAPLSRVEYPVGELITSADGEQLKVTEVQNQAGCILYIGKNNNGDTVELEEIDLDSFVSFSKPQDRLFSGQIEKSSSFQLRVETQELPSQPSAIRCIRFAWRPGSIAATPAVYSQSSGAAPRATSFIGR